MKYLAATLLLTALAVAPAAADTPVVGGDAAVFAGRTDDSQRYLRLGELALENDDGESAAAFLKQSLSGLTDPAQRRQAADLLQESLLMAQQVAEADILFDTMQKAPEFAGHSRELELMQGRRFFYEGELDKAIKIFRNLSVQLKNGDRICLQALSMLGKALGQKGDHAAAQKCFADLAAVAGNDGLWHYKALEGLIFHALNFGDMRSVKQARESIRREIPVELQQTFSGRLKKLDWLIGCANGQLDKVETVMLAEMKKLRTPDPLLARTAFAAAAVCDDLVKRLQFSQFACKFAERSFQETALIGLIEAENAMGLWRDAAKHAQEYLRDYPNSSRRYRIQFLTGLLCCKLDRSSEAINRFRQLFDDDTAPRQLRLDAAVALAKLYQKSQRVQDAVAMFRFVIGAEEITAEQRSDLEQQLGEYFYQLGRYSEAAAAFGSAVKSNSKNTPEAALWHAQTLYQLKKYHQSRIALAPAQKSPDENIKRKALYLDAMLEEKIVGSDAAIKLFIRMARNYPKSPEAPEALFHAGVLAMGSQRYRASEIFNEFAAQYPGEQAANALYKALIEELAGGREKEGARAMDALRSRYPDSKFTIGGYFRMAAYFSQTRRYEEALKVLAEVEAKYVALHSDLMPEILYDRACIYRELGDTVNMQKALETVAHKYSSHKAAPQTFFMLGDFLMQRQDYSNALTAFQRARERASGVFAAACEGRTADAAYALYTRSRQEQYLTQAREGYARLLKYPALPAMLRYQSLYKAGRCMEDARDVAGALYCYRELLYQAVLAKREKRYYSPEWSAKALDSALKMLRAALDEASDKTQNAALRSEMDRLMKNGAELNLPGLGPEKTPPAENVKKKTE